MDDNNIFALLIQKEPAEAGLRSLGEGDMLVPPKRRTASIEFRGVHLLIGHGWQFVPAISAIL